MARQFVQKHGDKQGHKHWLPQAGCILRTMGRTLCNPGEVLPD